MQKTSEPPTISITVDDLLTRALNQNVPLFLDGDISNSSPRSASPYIISKKRFADQLGTNVRRELLVSRLLAAIDDIDDRCDVHAVLIGGSMLNLSVENPRDLDAVIFYSLKDGLDSSEVIRYLATIGQQGKQSRDATLDLRFVPVDVAPHILIKITCFFAGLYSSERGSSNRSNGALLMIDGEHGDGI